MNESDFDKFLVALSRDLHGPMRALGRNGKAQQELIEITDRLISASRLLDALARQPALGVPAVDVANELLATSARDLQRLEALLADSGISAVFDEHGEILFKGFRSDHLPAEDLEALRAAGVAHPEDKIIKTIAWAKQGVPVISGHGADREPYYRQGSGRLQTAAEIVDSQRSDGERRRGKFRVAEGMVDIVHGGLVAGVNLGTGSVGASGMLGPASIMAISGAIASAGLALALVTKGGLKILE